MAVDLADLRDRLGHYPVARYPVQHATVSFHLGSALLQAGRPDEAVAALGTAQEVFQRCRMALESAKAGLMLGIAQREAGDPGPAEAAFESIAERMADLDQPAEQAAALYNLGLVQSELGRADQAVQAWTAARALFLTAGHPGRAAAATRDLATALLAADRPDEAVELLIEALSWAEAAADTAGAAAVANLLGLARIATGDTAGAVTSLRLAAGSFPRALRPAEHAMATANLALAHEARGELRRARVLARQALAVPHAERPVRAQAQQLLARHPGEAGADLHELVVTEEPADWQPVLRVELTEAAGAGPAASQALMGTVLTALLAENAADGSPVASDPYARAEGLLAVVLELPPGAFHKIVVAIDAAATDEARPATERDRLRAVIASAVARFAIPQWQRVVAELNAAAQARGGGSPWS